MRNKTEREIIKRKVRATDPRSLPWWSHTIVHSFLFLLGQAELRRRARHTAAAPVFTGPPIGRIYDKQIPTGDAHDPLTHALTREACLPGTSRHV